MRAGAWFILFLIVIAVSVPAFSDSSNKFWLLYEQGNTAAAQKEYGKALQLYKSAIESAGIFPEAEAAIGDVYMVEGEAVLAQRQYQKAYDLRKSFTIPDSQYDILYKLANLFELQQLYRQMEDTLSLIVADDKRFQETPNQRLRTQVENNFYVKGLDRVLTLYNFDESFAAAAHSKLGWFYYRTGRLDQAVSQLLYSVIYRASQIERSRKDLDVEYEFSTLAELLAAVDGRPDLRSYASVSGLYRDLYYLAGSAFNKYPQHSLGIWRLLSNAPSAGQYKDLSTRQLKTPFREPLLTVSK
jgi:hypothetical protein